AHGFRTAHARAAGGADRSRAPRAAHPARLRGRHRADHPRPVGEGDAGGAGRGRSRDAEGAKNVKHLLGIADLSAQDLKQILDLAETFVEISERPIKKVPTLRGKTVINLFLEPSTRTRTSFELAGKRLSADVINISGSTSSAVKGETLLDTVKNLEAMHPDVVVIRHYASGAPHFIAERTSAAVINAGDGTHEPPTQALLDAFTIRRAKGRLAGLTVAICGDVAHSRVARSNAHLLGAMGANVRFAGPRTLLPTAADALGADV